MSIAPAPAAEMTVLTEESPPFNFTIDGVVTGSSTEIVRELLRRLDHPGTIQVLPWARAYRMLQSEPRVALFTTARTPEREDRFHWIGPLAVVHYGFYARSDSGLELGSLEDAKAVRAIATYKDDVREQLLEAMGFANLDSSKSPASNLKKLLTGRVDLWLFDNLGMPDLARQQNVDPADLKLVLPFRSYRTYVAISRQTPDEEVGQWRRAFREMVEDGSFFFIARRWLPPESIPNFEAGDRSSEGTPTIQLFTEDAPPVSTLKDGRPEGFAVDVVREILLRLKQPDTISVVPWARGYTLALRSPNTAVFSTTRIPRREDLFQWVGPLYSQTWGLYSRKGAGIRLDSLEAAKSAGRIGTYRKDAKEEYLASQGFRNLMSASRNHSNLQHLMQGDIDLWVSSDLNVPYHLQRAGLPPDRIERVLAFKEVTNYIAFSLETPPEVVRQWQRCLDEIKADGTYGRIALRHHITLHSK